MARGYAVRLVQRALLSLRGKDAHELLQGVTTNDLRRLEKGGALYTLLLNTRGRIEHDLIVYHRSGGLLVECDAERRVGLKKTLEMYRMHKQVAIQPSDTPVFFVEHSCEGAVPDPRIPSFGNRLVADAVAECSLAEPSSYEERRFGWGIPEGSVELRGALPVYRNADLLHGMSADKGCYLGQEVTARALRGDIRKRVLPFTCHGSAKGSVVDGEGGASLGEVLACNGRVGLALLRLDRGEVWRELRADAVPLTPFPPPWWPQDATAVMRSCL